MKPARERSYNVKPGSYTDEQWIKFTRDKAFYWSDGDLLNDKRNIFRAGKSDEWWENLVIDNAEYWRCAYEEAQKNKHGGGYNYEFEEKPVYVSTTGWYRFAKNQYQFWSFPGGVKQDEHHCLRHNMSPEDWWEHVEKLSKKWEETYKKAEQVVDENLRKARKKYDDKKKPPKTDSKDDKKKPANPVTQESPSHPLNNTEKETVSSSSSISSRESDQTEEVGKDKKEDKKGRKRLNHVPLPRKLPCLGRHRK